MLKLGLVDLFAIIALIAGASAAFFAVADDVKEMAELQRENEDLRVKLLLAETREEALLEMKGD